MSLRQKRGSKARFTPPCLSQAARASGDAPAFLSTRVAPRSARSPRSSISAAGTSPPRLVAALPPPPSGLRRDLAEALRAKAGRAPLRLRAPLGSRQLQMPFQQPATLLAALTSGGV